jgi:N6-adenosine-specific RNA methylase IME4
VDLGDLKKIRDQALALQCYVRAQGLSSELQAKAAGIRVDAEARLGELLRERVPDEGTEGPGRGRKTPSPKGGGFSSKERTRFRALARVPEATREALKARLGDELTPTGLLRLAHGQEKQERAESVRANVVTGPDVVRDLEELAQTGAKFSTVYADPPWAYGNQGTRAATDSHYVTMSVEEIAALPVKDVLLDCGHLHLWTTNAFLFDAKTVLEAWGFEYRSCFVWVKPQMGIGNYWRVSHEFLLLGVRGGALPFRDKNLMSWVALDRTEHSRKPEPVRMMIERASPGPYLELFGRRAVEGWSVMGNEVAPAQERLFPREVAK